MPIKNCLQCGALLTLDEISCHKCGVSQVVELPPTRGGKCQCPEPNNKMLLAKVQNKDGSDNYYCGACITDNIAKGLVITVMHSDIGLGISDYEKNEMISMINGNGRIHRDSIPRNHKLSMLEGAIGMFHRRREAGSSNFISE